MTQPPTPEEQMPRRRIASCLALLAVLAWPSIQASNPNEGQWRFTVLLDGKPVGHHHVDLVQRDGELEYRSETRLNVKILFVTVFRYLHRDTETWRDDCLTKIESTTEEGGKAQFLRGMRGSNSFAIATERGSKDLPAPCVMTFAYWNPRILSATRLMNAQTGEYVPVHVEALGAEQVLVGGTRIGAEHFAIVGEKLKIELWYDPQRRWIALATTTERGGRLEYVLM
jgi:hypothetical protein